MNNKLHRLIPCPAHDDDTPSLSLTRKGGKWLTHCHAGCSPEAVWAALQNSGALHTLKADYAGVPVRDARPADLSEKIDYILQTSVPAPDDHPYLQRKGVKNHGLRLYKGCLLIPLSGETGSVQSLQFIDADGKQRFLSGGQKKGGYFMIGTYQGVICIAEGYATAASIFESTGHATVVAFDAGNLESVGKAIRKKYPEAKIIICADDDNHSKANPGMTKARQAAQLIGAFIAKPECKQ
ncbi:MAG: toprim domain-containing protein [Alphaproteobacteria bacterium]|nr:toprim domain-containing protein [Alphaproteobacteria bacterium]